MWIMLITKLSTEVSPPRLSIFWSAPYADENAVLIQFKKYTKSMGNLDDSYVENAKELPDDFYKDENGRKYESDYLRKKKISYMENLPNNSFYTMFGKEHNYAKARKIVYKNNEIRVYPDEFSVMTAENMNMYVNGYRNEPPSHELIAEGVASKELQRQILAGALREVYDAALVDGCQPDQATSMAMGIDVSNSGTLSLADFPAMGWYKCKPEYASIYCDEYEMSELSSVEWLELHPEEE